MSVVNHDGGVAGPVRVQPAELRRCARALEQRADELAALLAATAPALTATGTGSTGWAAVSVAQETTHRWSEWFDDCVAAVAELAERVNDAAESYEHCDARARARFAEAVPW